MKDDEIEWRYQPPPFVPAFAQFVEEFQRVPAQDEFKEYYVEKNRAALNDEFLHKWKQSDRAAKKRAHSRNLMRQMRKSPIAHHAFLLWSSGGAFRFSQGDADDHCRDRRCPRLSAPECGPSSTPPSGAHANAGAEVAIQSTAMDAPGIAHVELWADGAIVCCDALPAPQTS